MLSPNQPTHKVKRMRLGTKSCSECRRRKVRCTFNEGSDRCGQCILHKAVCKSQRPEGSEGEIDTPEDLQGRLENIEGLVQKFYQFLSQDATRQGVQNLAIGQDLNTPSSGLIATPSKSSDDSGRQSTDGDFSSFDEAPLLNFLRQSLVIQSRPKSSQSPQSPWKQANGFAANKTKYLLPHSKSLWAVLNLTQRFWPLWTFTSDMVEQGQNWYPVDVPAAMTFIDESLKSDNPGVISKALAWLALCLQQLPKDFEENTASLPLRAPDLLLYYLSQADALILDPSAPKPYLECIEALILQFRCFINTGKPLRAWKCTRNALEIAMLLGIHRVSGEEFSYQRALWTTLWQQDRHLSMLLGLPYAVPEQFIDIDGDIYNIPLEATIMHRLILICGHIIDRDQSRQHSLYSATVSIEEEMDKLKQMIPNIWWTPNYRDTVTPIGTIFQWRVAIFYFYNTSLTLHLPYLVKPAEERKYDHNKATVLESVEGMIRVYQEIRAYDGFPINCDSLDFIVFSAAVILAANLVSPDSQRSLEEEERLWAIIVQLARNYRYTVEMLECTVAAQSAEVLEYLYAARHGIYNGPEDYEVAIPFFGKVHIKPPKSQVQEAWDSAASISQPQQINCVQGNVELSSNAFTFRHPTEYEAAYELGENWATGMGFEGPYDWNFVFDFSGVS